MAKIETRNKILSKNTFDLGQNLVAWIAIIGGIIALAWTFALPFAAEAIQESAASKKVRTAITHDFEASFDKMSDDIVVLSINIQMLTKQFSITDKSVKSMVESLKRTEKTRLRDFSHRLDLFKMKVDNNEVITRPELNNLSYECVNDIKELIDKYNDTKLRFDCNWLQDVYKASPTVNG